jgi:hypothetical protein
MKVTSSEDPPQSDSPECRRGAAAARWRAGLALQGAQVCERGIPDRHPNVSRVQRGACYLIPIHKGLDMEFARFSGRIFVLSATLLASAALAAAPVSAATTPDKAKHAHDAAKPKKKIVRQQPRPVEVQRAPAPVTHYGRPDYDYSNGY